MKVNLNLPSYTAAKPNFKSNITFDIGGSQREGSCKIYYASTPKDELIYKMNKRSLFNFFLFLELISVNCMVSFKL